MSLSLAYDEHLAQRVRALLARRDDLEERRMFGGIKFMVAGKMACGIVGAELVARVGPERYEQALCSPHARPMDFTGRPLRGLVYVAAVGLRTEAMLRRWVDETVAFAGSKPEVEATGKRRSRRPRNA